MLPVLSCLSGIYLGFNFRVLVLLPISLTGSAIFLIVNLLSGQDISAALLELLMMLVAVQSGYVLGVVGRDLAARVEHGRAPQGGQI